MWYNNLWFVFPASFVILTNVFGWYILSALVTVASEPEWFYIVRIHKETWVKIWNNKELNKAGKIFCEIIYTIFLFPSIVLLYVFGLFSIMFGFLFTKLFVKKRNE